MSYFRNKSDSIFAAVLAIGIAFGFITAFGCTQDNSNSDATKPTFKMAFIGSLSGDTSTFSQSALRGLELALEEARERGLQVEWVVKDNAGSPKTAIENIQSLVADPQMLVIFGEISSAMSLTIAPVAQKAKVPMITPASTHPRVTEVGDYIFRVSFIDPFQGEAMARFAFQNLNLTKVAIFTERHSDYSKGLAEYFAKTFVGLGGKVVSEEFYNSGDTQFDTALDAIRKSQPQALYIPGYYKDVALIAREARKRGLQTQLLGGDGWDSEELYADGQEAVVGAYYSNHFTADRLDSEVTKRFVEKYKARFSATPDGLAARSYDAFNIAVAALEKSKTKDRKGLRDALAKTSQFQGVTGVTTLNKFRNAEKPAVVLKVSGPNHTYVTTIAPK